MGKPTERTLKLLKQTGFQSGIVERFIRGAGPFGKHFDLFGIGDLISMGNGQIWLVQSCGADFKPHHIKLTTEEPAAENLKEWLSNGGLFVLIGWRHLLKKRGGKAKYYRPRIRIYKLARDIVFYKDVDADFEHWFLN